MIARRMIASKWSKVKDRNLLWSCFTILSVVLNGFLLTMDMSAPAHKSSKILISYGYYEKDDLQKDNFDFFILTGMEPSPTGQLVHWAVVTSTMLCTPCKRLIEDPSDAEAGPENLGIRSVVSSTDITLIYRTENEGMDIACHNVSLSYFKFTGRLWSFQFFFFINSSTKGPFVPSYVPLDWHWTHAYLVRFHHDIHVVSSSLVCLPPNDAGGPGPRVESWAYSTDAVGLRVLLEANTFAIRSCKLCKGSEGIVVGGEYGITTSMFKAGYNVATLMSKYSKDVDWRDKSNWNCNNNVHPSRHGTYDGISFHPYETVFVKSSWHVADPYTQRYAAWTRKHLAGKMGTEGRLDNLLYNFAISTDAQAPNKLESLGYSLNSSIAAWQARTGFRG